VLSGSASPAEPFCFALYFLVPEVRVPVLAFSARAGPVSARPDLLRSAICIALTAGNSRTLSPLHAAGDFQLFPKRIQVDWPRATARCMVRKLSILCFN